MTVDMNAVRAARREALGEGPEVAIGEQTFRCPPDLPFDALVAGSQAEQGNAAATYEFVRVLLGEEGLRVFRAWKPSYEEVKELVKGLMDEYGQTSDNGDGKADAEGSGEARG